MTGTKAETKPSRRKAKAPEGTADSGKPMRFPHGITLALTATSCARCPGRPLIYAAVINGLERHLDPLPLSAEGLLAATVERRWLAIVNPYGPPVAHRLTPGHWWIKGYGEGHRPLLLAEHAHGRHPLPHDVALAGVLLPRFLPPAPPDPNAPCPF